MSKSVKERASGLARTHLKGYVKRALGAGPDDPAYPRIQWVKARVRSAMAMQPIYRGVTIEWDAPMHAWCVPFDVAGPGPDEVVIRTLYSAISTGTEVAGFCVRPNTQSSFPCQPGYSGVGEIIRVGRKVKHLAPGQIVAGRAAHASLGRLRASEAFALPDGVGLEDAAFIHIGNIAYHGIQHGRIRHGERVVVIGRGIIGQIATQIAKAMGAGEVISIARTRSHVTDALSRVTDRVIATADIGEDLDGVLAGLAADAVVEVSGDPSALHQAVCATRDGGRVVLLGSSRGSTRGFDFGELADRRISLVGANIRALTDPRPGSTYNYHRTGDAFLRLVAEGKVDLQSLTSVKVDPWEAGRFYRLLATGASNCVGALFCWKDLDPDDRMRPVSFTTPPDLSAIEQSKMLRSGIGEVGHD